MPSQLAASEFALADFRASAETYRKLITSVLHDKESPTPVQIAKYADALGSAGRHADAAREFQATFASAKNFTEDLATRVKMEQAGLEIMAGNDSKARSLTEGNT